MSIWRRRLQLSLLVFLLAGSGAVFGAYSDHGRRDLFVPLLTADGQRIYPPGLDDEAEVSGAPVLQGIVFDPESDSYAIINGAVVREGELIEGMTVTEIKPQGVALERNGQPLILKLPSLEPEEVDKTP